MYDVGGMLGSQGSFELLCRFNIYIYLFRSTLDFMEVLGGCSSIWMSGFLQVVVPFVHGANASPQTLIPGLAGRNLDPKMPNADL